MGAQARPRSPKWGNHLDACPVGLLGLRGDAEWRLGVPGGAGTAPGREDGPVDDAELFEVLADLEAEAETMHHLERSPEIADRSRAEYQSVHLEARLMASVGTRVTLRVTGVGTVAGRLDRMGDQWCRLEAAHLAWTVRTPAVVTARGLSSRAVPRVAWSRLDTLGVGSALRDQADRGSVCVLHLGDGSTVEGRVLRVGGDFVEVIGPDEDDSAAGGVLVPLAALVAWRTELA